MRSTILREYIRMPSPFGRPGQRCEFPPLDRSIQALGLAFCLGCRHGLAVINRCFPLVLAFVVVSSGMTDAADKPTAKLLAGAAISNITPELGIDIVGGFVPFPATHVHDELHARCLVLDDGNTKLAMVVCDLVGVHRSLVVEARGLIEKATGIPAANVMVSATHTHSAGNALGATPRGYYSDQELTDYQRFVAHRIADGVQRAMNLRRPAEIAFGTTEAPEHVFNRRWLMKPGTVPETPFGGTTDKVKMNPRSGDPNLVEPAGPTDPTISFIALREPEGRLISVFSAYSLHYVGNVGSGHISADYYGMYCEALKRLQPSGESDPPFVAIMANGTSGDVNNVNFRSPRPRMPPYTQMRIVAEDVAKKVQSALTQLTWSDHASLDARYRELGIAWRKVEPELLDWAKETEAKAKRMQSKDDKSTVYAGRIQRLAKASPGTKAPVQVLRIGDVCIGASPGETFAETGLEFKKRSPIKRSFIVELANGYYGYLPPPRHFELGGYETWPGTNNLEPQATVIIVDALLEMANELHRTSQ
jgi:neutral ceramidase